MSDFRNLASMASISPLAIAFICITVLSAGAFVFFSVQLHRNKGTGLAWRGIVKLVSLQGIPAGLSALYPRWFATFWAVFISVCLSVACLVWGTDHSFLIVIFPLLFYYFFARFFLWEKADLTD